MSLLLALFDFDYICYRLHVVLSAFNQITCSEIKILEKKVGKVSAIFIFNFANWLNVRAFAPLHRSRLEPCDCRVNITLPLEKRERSFERLLFFHLLFFFVEAIRKCKMSIFFSFLHC